MRNSDSHWSKFQVGHVLTAISVVNSFPNLLHRRTYTWYFDSRLLIIYTVPCKRGLRNVSSQGVVGSVIHCTIYHWRARGKRGDTPAFTRPTLRGSCPLGCACQLSSVESLSGDTDGWLNIKKLEGSDFQRTECNASLFPLSQVLCLYYNISSSLQQDWFVVGSYI